ncbi:MAG: hypothetical protein LVQ75_04580 [Candidatus Babeliales bacterium]|jgi:hypothetical protein
MEKAISATVLLLRIIQELLYLVLISVGEESERGFDWYEHFWLEQESRNWSNISKHSLQGIIIYQAMQTANQVMKF